MSSGRSRSGGIASSRPRAGSRGPRGSGRASPRAPRSRLVAATTRTSTCGLVRRRPTRRTSPVSSARKQLGLHVERQLADLVEEQRAAVGDLERAGAVARSAPVNAPRSWPNSSTRDQRRADARRSRRRRTGPRARASPRGCARGDQLLADAGLALDEHVDERAFEPLEQREEPRASPPTRRPGRR